jgi:transcriptional regulator with XRE-family HTH domain
MTNALHRINQIASPQQSGWLEDAKQRKENKGWTKRSMQIAVRILREIRAQKPVNGMTQKTLADAMGVSPQYINKIVKGQENLTLGTIAKIEQILGIVLIEVAVPRSSTVKNDGVDRNKAVPMGGIVIEFKNNYSQPTGTNG